MPIQWVVTNQRNKGGWFLSDPTGWRFHAIEAEEADTFESVKNHTAACGLRARYGWTIDLYIEDAPKNRCKRCVHALDRASATSKDSPKIVT